MKAPESPALRLIPAPLLTFGSFVDCTMAEAWVDGQFRIFPGKYGEDPVWGDYDELKFADGPSAQEAFATEPDGFTRAVLPPNASPGTPGLHGAVWFESIYQPHADGQLLYALYHNENYPSTLPYDPQTGQGYRTDNWPPGLQGDSSPQAVPRIGLMRSDDGGRSWRDLGIILEDPQDRLILSPINRNNTFPGGVGDPCAVSSGDYLYVFFGEYGYPETYDQETHDPDVEHRGQCVSVARIALADLARPQGKTQRWVGGGFDGDGEGAPIESLMIPRSEGGGPVSAGDKAFHWGPTVSWNEHLQCWVMLMARVDQGYWVGDSVWYSTNPHRDLGASVDGMEGAASQQWSEPRLLLRKPGYTLWYPTLQPTGSDQDIAEHRSGVRLGSTARLWVKQIGQGIDRYFSEYEVQFDRD